MVAKRKIPKKKLKEPDEFITWGSRAMNYALVHLKYIGLGFLLVGVIILALILWRQHMTISEERAFALLGRGITLYHQEEKTKEALQVFTRVIKDHPRTRAAKMALLYRGRCYMLRRDYDRAIADFERFTKSSSEAFLRAIAFNAMGNSYLAKGKYQKAIDCFQQVLSLEQGWLKPYVLLQMGMCWEKLGNATKASTFYRDALKLSLATPWANLATLRLKRLEVNSK